MLKRDIVKALGAAWRLNREPTGILSTGVIVSVPDGAAGVRVSSSCRRTAILRILPPIVCVALQGLATTALAQTAAPPIRQSPIAATPTEATGADSVPGGDIVVTAQRRAQNLQDVPASVAAVTGATLSARSIVTINDLSAVVANLQVSNPYGTGSPPAFTIRGISSTDFSANQSRPIAIYIDEGIRQLPSFEAVPLFDIDHIEVLRGPQGALYGKNATGGAINIITTRPGFDTSGYLQAGYGNFDRRESEGAFQTALVPDVLAVRLAYTFVKNDGTIENLYPGNPDVVQTDIFAVRGSLLFTPHDSIEVLARYTHSFSGGRGPGIYADNIDFPGAGFPELAEVPGSSRQGLGFFQSNQNFIGRRHIYNDGGNVQIKVDLPHSFVLTSITTYDRGKWLETVDTDGTAVDQERDSDNADNERQFVEEVRLTGKAGPAQLLLGGFYSHDKVDIHYQYTYFNDPACIVSCVDLSGFGDGSRGYILSNYFTQRRDSYAAYGRVEVDLTPQLKLAGGARWSHDRVAVANYTAYFGDPLDPLAYQTIPPTSLARSFSNVSAEAVLTWQPSDDVTSYASFKQGYRTGAINGQAYTDVSEIVTAAPPEKANSWEIGVKTKPVAGVIFNVAGFYATYRNQQITSPEIDANTSLLIYPLRSIDRSRIYGAEADLSIRLLRDVSLFSSLGYTNAEYTKGIVAGEDVAGNQLSNSAKWSGNTSVEWTAAQIGGGTLTLRADATYQSKVYYDVYETPTIVGGGHVVTGASATLEIGNWSLTAWATNLLNEHYFTNGLNTAFEGFVYKVRGTPREFGARLRARF